MAEQRNGFGVGDLLLVFLGGAAAGAAAAYLTAPRSGDESLRQLRERADETRETVRRVPLALKDAMEAARDAFTEALAETPKNGTPG